ncbi:ABC transporter substrate-binding protein [Hahella ganghwensis]|uniref:ABC transporter substrate-binding protein n=1 Tax=Hahella ganghwensis TaxID=286420 RepID=UPI00037D7BD2|nr:ABC transporter substrate-binding protein [Hahella ganghwensis]
MKTYTRVILLIITLCFVGKAFSMNIAMVVWRGETIAERSFISELNRLGHQPAIDVFDAGQDRKQLAHILRQRLQPNLNHYDYVYTFGTTVSETVKTFLNGERPQVFNIVADPLGSSLVSNGLMGIDNIIGVTNTVPADKQIANARTLLKFKSLAIPYNPREINSALIIGQLKALGQELGFSILPVRVRPDEKIWQEDLKPILNLQEVDAVYLPPDSFMISKANKIMPLLNEARMPTICAVAQYMKHGCLMGTVADYETLGRLAANIVDRLIKGENISEIPLQYDPAPIFKVNQSLLKELNQ